MRQIYLFTGGYTEPTQMGSGETVPGRCEGIGCYVFDQETGELSRRALTPSTPNPSYITAAPDAPYLYCVNELKEYEGVPGSTVSAYRIDPKTGGLTFLNRQFTCGADACYVSLTADGRHLLTTNFSGGSFAVFPISADHSLEPASCVLRHAGSGSDALRQAGPHPHQVIPAPDGEHIFITDLGLDRIACYRLDWERGWLLAEPEQDLAGLPGQGIRHGVFDQSGKHLYVMTEMTCEVNVYAWGTAGKGELVQTVSALRQGDKAGTGTMILGAAIRLHPSGKWLYASVRGCNYLAVFRVLEDGRLALSQIADSRGEIPRDFIVSPNGRYLLAAHQDTDSICVFEVDPATGQLSYRFEVKGVGAVTVLAPWSAG